MMTETTTSINFDPSETQRMVADSARDFCRAIYPATCDGMG